ITNDRMAFTRDLLSSNRDKLEKLAGLLLEHESADADRVREAIGLPAAPSGAGGPRVVREPVRASPVPAAASNDPTSVG
ncbi:MAG: hypothetical protein ACYDAG_17005, partial [Chloroflexota bacterium]